MSIWRLLIGSLLLPLWLIGTELKPWFDNDRVPIWRNSYAFQAYERVDTMAGQASVQGRNHLLHSSLAITSDDLSAEIEGFASQSKIRNFSWENSKLTGRIQLFDDVLGDPLSLVVGMSFALPMRHAVRDFNLLYHGVFEGELHLAVGRETSCLAVWTTRWWALLTAGLANRGAPWLRARVTWVRNIRTSQHLELYADGYAGLGHHDLSLTRPFRGYGGIAYRGVDLAVAYRYFTDWYGVFSFEYSFRPYARNLPLYVQQGTVGWRYDFCL